jgi:hypothetical protein
MRTLTEAVVEAALHRLHVPHAAAASRLAPDGLDAPVVCDEDSMQQSVRQCHLLSFINASAAAHHLIVHVCNRCPTHIS